MPGPRRLTETEARVASSLFGAGAEAEESRIRLSEVPRTSYLEAKRRLFDEGLLDARFFPEPQLLGLDCLTVSTARPHLDQILSLSQAWEQEPGATLVWRGTQSMLGVFLSRSRSDGARLAARLTGEDLTGRSTVMHCDLKEPTAPVYFDFEGAWRNMSTTGRSMRYPRSIGGWGPTQVSKINRNSQLRRCLRSLLDLNPEGVATSAPDASRGRSPTALPRSLRRALDQGLVQWRVLPKLGNLLGCPGVDIEEVLIISGELRADARPLSLFNALVREGRSYPFLFLTDGERVVVGGLGTRRSVLKGGQTSRPVRRSILGVLQDHATSIDVVREKASTLRLLVDHRFGGMGVAPGPTT